MAGLFSGIGGFEFAASEMNWEVVFTCENNKFCQRILKYYWEKAKHYEDIKTTDFAIWNGKIDILTGGFPCQPFSVAGQRKGSEDDRYLWAEMLRAIKEIQPSYIVAENVYGLISWKNGILFEQICINLENEGYEVQPYIIPALSVDAPHNRKRLWIVAYRANTGAKSVRERADKILKERFVTHPNSDRPRNGKDEQKQIEKCERTTDNCISCKNGITTNTTCERQRGESNRIRESGFINKTSKKNDWENFPTQSPICGGDDGLPSELYGITFSKWRKETIKGYGNAIVRQVAIQIFKTIENYENKEN